MDERLLHEIDDKVADQQATMQSAGVPGFYVTKDPKVRLICFSCDFFFCT